MVRLTIDESTKQTEGHVQTIPHYEQNANQLVAQYESLTFEDVHPSILDLLPASGATILDVGAGSGRDAAWFAGNVGNAYAASGATWTRYGWTYDWAADADEPPYGASEFMLAPSTDYAIEAVQRPTAYCTP